MLISFNWLKKYINLPTTVTPEAVAVKLKLSTVEVEKVERLGANLENIVVGKILKVEKHPNADKLKICQVDVGKEKLKIVCGGSNVRDGMLVAVAKIGAKVRWHGQGELVELKPVAIRGVESQGMICASAEIGLREVFPSREEKEIIDLSSYPLSPTTPNPSSGRRGNLGQPLAEALGLDDVIFEIDNKSLSHRPDLWGHYGLAREVATLFKKSLKPYKVAPIKRVGAGLVPARGGAQGPTLQVRVEDKKLCPRYMAVAVSGIKIQESPEWLKKSLLAIGLRPINNIVDITNYVMFDLGQPMHAFDNSKLSAKGGSASGGKTQNSKVVINVRQAKSGEEFVTLDNEKKILDSSTLIIADAEKPIALAGVIGGLQSGISDKTNTIIFESANFDAVSIRKTSTKLGLRTESSARFEKSLDPNLCELALRKAVELTLQLCPGAKMASAVADEKKFKLSQGPLKLSLEIFEQKLGVKIAPVTINSILKSLGFQVKKAGKFLSVKIPTWRATKDISIVEDIVEEVARVYGFEKIPASLPSFPIVPPASNQLFKLERQARDILVKTLAYTEVYNYSFVSREQVLNLSDDSKKYLELDNPLSKERPLLRRNLLLNLLENIIKNIEFKSSLRLFELGKVFLAEERGMEAGRGSDCLPLQDTWLTAIFADKENNQPFWQARRVVESLNDNLRLSLSLQKVQFPKFWWHPGRSAIVLAGAQTAGAIYELHPQIAKKFGLDVRVGVAEINLDKLAAPLSGGQIVYKSIPAFPEVARDLAIIVSRDASHGAIVNEIMKISPLLKIVELFDCYQGDKIERGKKSLAYHLVFGSNEHTLTTPEIDETMRKIVLVLERKFGAKLRT